MKKMTQKEFETLLKEMEDGLSEETKQRLNKMLAWSTYGINLETGQIARYSASYRHTQTAEYRTVLVVVSSGRIDSSPGHPRSCGVTRGNGWIINPERA